MAQSSTPMFTTERLKLRAFEGPKDADRLLELANNAQVAPLITNGPVVPMGPAHKEVLSKVVDVALMYCMIDELDSGIFVGHAFFAPKDPKNRTTELSIAFMPKFWDKGYGTETLKFMIDYGFRNLALHRISLKVFSDNSRAIAVYRKLGFKEEGKARQSVWSEGGWVDTIFMGILDYEWKEQAF